MFGFKRKKAAAPFDRTGKIPVIRSSICTGEKVAGYRDAESGGFTEVMLIRDDGDLREFLESYGFDRDELEYRW